MSIEIISIIASILGTGGLISGLLLRRMDKLEKSQDDREVSRKKENVLIITGIKAVGKLAEAAALAQKRGTTNGEMETALNYYTRFSDKLNEYLLEQNAEYNHGN